MRTDEPTGGIVSYFAAAVVRGAGGWTASELDLTGAADVEDVVERLRDAGSEAPVTLLFVEIDDAYLVILRLDDGEDLRVFGSDATCATESRLGAVLLGEVEEPAVDLDGELAEDERPAAAPAPAPTPDVEPVGDADLLGDLGLSAHRLLELCGREGMLPMDVTAEVCQALGCGDEVEELREV